MLRRVAWVVFCLSLWAGGAYAQAPEPIPLPSRPPMSLDRSLESNGQQIVIVERPRTPSLFYVDADLLLWWVHHGPAPSLVTTAPNNGVNANGLTGGIVGEPGTAVVFDGDNLNFGTFAALRLAAGINFGPDDFWTLEASGFVLPKKSIQFAQGGNGDGSPLLTIPFLDAATGQQSALDINAQDAVFNPFLSGSVQIRSDIQLWGVEANLLAHSIRTRDRSFDLMAGVRVLGMVENLTISETITPANDGDITIQYPTVGQGAPNYYLVVAGNPVQVFDSFATRNHFFGPQVGGRFQWMFGPLTMDLTGKIAVGITRQQVTINGSSSAALGIDPATGAFVPNLTTPGGVFALQSNSGNFTQNPFSVVPEIGFNVNWNVASWLRLRVGYSGLYWSNVARPGAHIDTVLNSKLVPTGALLPTNTTPIGAFVPGSEQGRPYFAFRDSGFWAHGINFGVEIRY